MLTYLKKSWTSLAKDENVLLKETQRLAVNWSEIM